MKKRKEFNRMIAACKRGRIDMILTKSLSRFARNTVDCLEMVRMLKANGIGVIFEKENINTLTESSEFLITLFSGFAQAESESLSTIITWGQQQSMKNGKVTFQYSKLLGYRRGEDSQPEIVPEDAETVKRIFRRYLDGCSLGQIKAELEADGAPTASGVKGWSYQVIHNRRIRPSVILLERVQIFSLAGKRFFAMGGASSHDIQDGILEPDDHHFRRKQRALDARGAMYRVNHLSWWKEELPSEDEYQTARANLEKAGWEVDYIITHCCPTSVQDELSGGFYQADALTDFLDEVAQQCRFRYWFFGHYHDNRIVQKKYVLLYEQILRLKV